jgi:hypothetical protein
MLFSTPMIQALLREAKEPGTGKTQTRRMIKPAPYIDANGNFCALDRKGAVWNWGQHVDGRPCTRNFMAEKIAIRPGDRVWVRESGNWRGPMKDHIGGGQVVFTFYAADSARGRCKFFDDKNRPSIHMPRWASRLTLYVSDVRVQRLQDISEADAVAEGIQPMNDRMPSPRVYGLYVVRLPDGKQHFGDNAADLYAKLWTAINGPGSWAENPWVVAYTFVPRLGNIDTLPEHHNG